MVEASLREQIRAAMQAMTDDASYQAKYRRARRQLDPEFRERTYQQHKTYARKRYEEDPEYKQRVKEAARQRSKAVLADETKKAELKAKRREDDDQKAAQTARARERYASDPEYRQMRKQYAHSAKKE